MLTLGDPSNDMPSNTRVLLIEDNAALAAALLEGMEQAGLAVAWATNGVTGIAAKNSFKPDVVLMDLVLPDMSGTALLTHLAEQRGCGIIIFSDMDHEADRIVALELGADDYIARPPHVREMIARIRAVHRRVSIPVELHAPSQAAQVLKVGPIRINVPHRTVHAEDGRQIMLTSAEFDALMALAGAAGVPVSRDQLSEAALRRPWRPEDRSVDQLVFNLRQKLPTDEGGRLIHSIRSSGYWLRAPDGTAQSSVADQDRLAA